MWSPSTHTSSKSWVKVIHVRWGQSPPLTLPFRKPWSFRAVSWGLDIDFSHLRQYTRQDSGEKWSTLPLLLFEQHQMFSSNYRLAPPKQSRRHNILYTNERIQTIPKLFDTFELAAQMWLNGPCSSDITHGKQIEKLKMLLREKHYKPRDSKAEIKNVFPIHLDRCKSGHIKTSASFRFCEESSLPPLPFQNGRPRYPGFYHWGLGHYTASSKELWGDRSHFPFPLGLSDQVRSLLNHGVHKDCSHIHSAKWTNNNLAFTWVLFYQ